MKLLVCAGLLFFSQLDDQKAPFYRGFGILITLFLFMFSYMVWDRRTAMKPNEIRIKNSEFRS